jgi:hypothetical protein
VIVWVALYVAFIAVAVWVLAWCRRGMEEIGRDTRLILIEQAKAEEDG